VKAVHLGGKSKAHARCEAWIEYYCSLYRYFDKHGGAGAGRALRIGRFLKLFANAAGSFALLFLTMGLHSRALRRFPVYVRLLAWHLMLCPDDWGLRGRKG